MRFYPHADTLEPELTRKDWADRDAQYLADDAEAFNRSYSTITTEQADDISRAINALKEALGRIGH